MLGSANDLTHERLPSLHSPSHPQTLLLEACQQSRRREIAVVLFTYPKRRSKRSSLTCSRGLKSEISNHSRSLIRNGLCSLRRRTTRGDFQRTLCVSTSTTCTRNVALTAQVPTVVVVGSSLRWHQRAYQCESCRNSRVIAHLRLPRNILRSIIN